MLKLTSLRRNENGFISAWMLGLAMILLTIGIVFVQFGFVLVDRQDLSIAADRASNAGATALDEDRIIDSDGQDIVLENTAGTPPSESAVERCNAVLANEATKPGSVVSPPPVSYCQLINGDTAIEVHVKGTIDLGVLASVVGMPEKEFEVVARARPSCSDSTNDSGDCG